MAATGSTLNYSINYPQGSDSVSLAADLQEMATDIDSVLLSKLNTSGGTMTGALVGTAITDSSSSTTGAFKTAGGMGIAKSLNVGQNANITGNVDISGTLTLATKTITLGGNFATSGAYNATLTLTDATNVTLPTTGTLATLAGSETLSNKTLTAPNIGAATGTSVALTGAISTDSTTNATSTTTGSIQTDGGIGVAKDVYVGGSVIAVNTPGHNLLHNGAMQIHQRGTSTTTTSAVTSYGPDRWHVYSGTTGRTVSVQTGTDEIRGCVRFQRDSGNSNTNVNYLGQNIETVNSRHLSGKVVTISLWARAGANYSAASNELTVQVRAGTGTDEDMFTGFTGNNNFISQTATLTTTWTKYEYSGTVPVGTTQLGAILFYTPVGTAGAADYFEVTGIQLEQGSSATPYDHKDYGQELRECQRYYYRHASGTNAHIAPGLGFSATEIYAYVNFPVTMRTAPSGVGTDTFGQSTGTDYYLFYRSSGSQAFTGFTLAAATPSVALLQRNGLTHTSGVAGMTSCNNASAQISFSADL